MPELGSGLDGGDLVEDPYPFYAQLRRDAPVWPVPGADAYLVSTWDLVAEATARVGDFSNHFRHALFRDDDGRIGVLEHQGGAPDVFAGADPPEHAIHRDVFLPALVRGKMEALEPYVSTLADELLDELLAAERAEVTSMLANPLPLRVMAERVIGFHDTNFAQLAGWVFAGSRLMGGRLRLDEMGPVAEQVSGLLPWVTEQLEGAMRSPKPGDILSAAAASVHDRVLTRGEATFTLMVLLGAGGETTTSLIGNAFRMLAEHREIQDALRLDPDRVPAFVEEALRLESPFRFHPRTARRPVMLGGVDIPAGALVALLWGAANRDPVVFDRPDDIVLDRKNAPLQLGFGRGIHHCVGAPLARFEARIVLTRLLQRTKHFVLDPDDAPGWVDSLWLRRHERLPLVIEPA